jgi:hypothetical protein
VVIGSHIRTLKENDDEKKKQQHQQSNPTTHPWVTTDVSEVN